MHGFRCEQGHDTEDLFSIQEDVPLAVVCPVCSAKAERRFEAPRPIGVSSTDLDDFNARLFSPAERARGAEIRTQSQLKAREEELGIRVMTSSEQRESLQWQDNDLREIGAAQRDGGLAGAEAHVDDTEIMDATGWGKSRLRKWQEATDAAERHVPDHIRSAAPG